jgi:hypothetical protein
MPKTGPVTRAGKAVSSRNATKHAIFSQSPVIPEFETEKDWQAHRAYFIDDLAPIGALEEALVERLVLTLWQQQRLVRFQRASVIAGSFRAMEGLSHAADYIQGLGGTPREEFLTDDRVERRLLECIVPGKDDLDRIMRYEAHLNRQFYQALHELEAVQLRRRGGNSPLARLDINTSPAT